MPVAESAEPDARPARCAPVTALLPLASLASARLAHTHQLFAAPAARKDLRRARGRAKLAHTEQRWGDIDPSLRYCHMVNRRSTICRGMLQQEAGVARGPPPVSPVDLNLGESE